MRKLSILASLTNLFNYKDRCVKKFLYLLPFWDSILKFVYAFLGKISMSQHCSNENGSINISLINSFSFVYFGDVYYEAFAILIPCN